MAIDLETAELVPLAKLVEQRLGRRISPSTLWRWRTSGIRGVRLECYCAAGIWSTTSAALAEFLRASSEALTPPQPPPAPPAERDAATTRRLRASGLL